MHVAPALPVELLYLILDQIIFDGDVPTLKAISTVSKAFRPACRKYLFHRIMITIASDRRYAQAGCNAAGLFLDFAKFLTSNMHVLMSVRQLVIVEVSGPPRWTIGCPSASVEEVDSEQGWDTVSGPLTRILDGIENLQCLEIRSDVELDWASFDTGIKRAIYGLLRRPSCGLATVRLSALRGVTDADLLALIEPCADVAFTQVQLEFSGARTPAREPDADMTLPCDRPDIGVPAPAPALARLTLGREMGVGALGWLARYPESLAGVRRLRMESLSAAAALEDLWKFAQGMRHALEHLEWWLEDLGFREQADAHALQQMDLSIFPHLRSLAVRSSQSGLLVNLMVVLESTGPENAIEDITIIMPSSVDKFLAFRPSAVWKRLDAAFDCGRFRKLRAVTLTFAYTNQAIQQRTLDALFATFKLNLPSLRGKDLTVKQRRVCPFWDERSSYSKYNPTPPLLF